MPQRPPGNELVDHHQRARSDDGGETVPGCSKRHRGRPKRHEDLVTKRASPEAPSPPRTGREDVGDQAPDNDASRCRYSDLFCVGERSGLVVGALRVEEFEGAFADLSRSVVFMLDIAAGRGDVVVADEPGHVFEIE